MPSEASHRPGARRRARAGRCPPPRRRSRGPCGPPRAECRRGRGGPRAPRSGCSRSRGRRRRGAVARRSPRARWPSKKRSAPSSRWPPVTTAARGRARGRRARAPRARRPAPSPVSARASGRFGRDDGGARQDPLDQRLLAPPARAGRRRSRRPSPGRRRPGASPTRSSASATAAIVGSSASIPIFTASTPMSVGDGAHLGDDDLRGQRLDRVTSTRVLRGDRGDRRRPVHAAARERLQVGLDPGAAAGVRAGDRQRDGNAARPGPPG